MRCFESTELEAAAEVLRAGEVLAFPTETVYGLGAGVFLPQAIAKVFLAKGRPSDNPLIVHMSRLEQLEQIVTSVTEEAQQLIQHFFPGPLTLILPKQACVPSLASAGLTTIGVRMPAHPLAQALIEKVGMPLVAPSANLSGKPSATQWEHVMQDFKNSIGGVLKGECGIGLESTVLLLDPHPIVLRPGSITAQQLEEVLKKPVIYHKGTTAQPLSPGMKYRHYAPDAHVQLCFSQQELDRAYTTVTGSVRSCIPRASSLYAELRQADLDGIKHLLILCTAEVQADYALMHRLLRAAQIS